MPVRGAATAAAESPTFQTYRPVRAGKTRLMVRSCVGMTLLSEVSTIGTMKPAARMHD